MKKLMYGALFLALSGILIVACKKEVAVQPDTTETAQLDVKKSPSNENEKIDGGRIRIFKVELHRPEGKINRDGVDCLCTLCAGFCDFEWFPD